MSWVGEFTENGSTTWGDQQRFMLDEMRDRIEALETPAGTALPAHVCGEYWPKYQSVQDLATIPTNVNLVYLFQAGPAAADSATYPSGSGAVVLIGEGGGVGTFALEDDAWWLGQVSSIRARGTIVMLSIGGAGAYVDLSTVDKRQACLDSIIDIYDRVGGFDGLDFNLETTENGLPVYPDNMVWVAQQLRARYGSQFCFSIPVAQHTTATYIQHDIDIVTALLAAGVMNFVAPQIYDGFQTMTESQKITLVNKVMNFWAPYVNNDWSKLGIGFLTVGTSAQAMSVASSYVAYNLLASQHPEIRGAFHFDAKSDSEQDWEWANTLAPRIQSNQAITPPPSPISLVDSFASIDSAKWDSGGTVTSTSGKAVMPVNGYSAPNYLISKTSFNVGSATVQWQIATPPVATGFTSGGTTVYEAFQEVWLIDPSNSNNYVKTRVTSNQTTQNVEVHWNLGVGEPTPDYNLGFTSTDRHYRIYVSNGYLQFESAPDNSGQPGTWKTRWLADVNDMPSLASMKVKLSTSGHGNDVSWESFGTVSTSTSPTTPTPGSFTDVTVSGTLTVGGSAVSVHDPTALANGDVVLWGSDTNLYRTAANSLKTDDDFTASTLAISAGTLSAKVPEEHGLKAWTCDPAVGNSGTRSVTAGVLYATSIIVRRSITVTKIWYSISTVGSGLTSSQNWVGIYTAAGSKLADVGTDSAFTGSGVQSGTISSQVLTPGRYLIVWVSNGTTPPVLTAMNTGTGIANAGISTASGLLYFTNTTGQTTLPSSITLASNVSTSAVWAAVS